MRPCLVLQNDVYTMRMGRLLEANYGILPSHIRFGQVVLAGFLVFIHKVELICPFQLLLLLEYCLLNLLRQVALTWHLKHIKTNYFLQFERSFEDCRRVLLVEFEG